MPVSEKPRAKKRSYRRPIGQTANKMWEYATRPEELVPQTQDHDQHGVYMTGLAGLFLITQGPKAGSRFGDVMLPWQRDFLHYLFGETDENGHRVVRRALLKCGKGSGKSVLAAVIALAVLMDCVLSGKNHRALLMILSPTVATSDIIFGHLLEAIAADPELKAQFATNMAKRTLTHVETGICIQIAPAKLDATIGRRPLLVLVDELHSCAVECKTFGQVLDQARRGGQNWGPEYLEIAISTSPPERSTGIWAETLQYARKVRDGAVHDPSFLPVLYEWPLARTDLDPEDENEWWRGMPSCTPDGTMDPRELRREFDEAHRTGNAREMASLLSQRLGVEPNEGGGGQSILQDRFKQLEEPQTANPSIEMVALDPGGVNDPFAVAFAWWEDPDHTIIGAEVRQYLTRYGYDDAPEALRDVYDAAIACGELKILNGIGDLDAAVMTDLRDVYSVNACRIGGDRHGRAGFVPGLEQTFMQPGSFLEISQGWKLVRAYTAIEGLILDGKIRVKQTPLLRFNVMNLRMEDGPSGRRFAKADAGLSGQGSMKIDGTMALLSAVEMMLEHFDGGFDVAQLIG